MGTVFKKTFTKPLPLNAEVFTSKGETFAKVKPPKGRTVTYPVTTGKNGSQRILVETGTYVAKYRDGSGIIHNEKSRPAAAKRERLDQSWPNWNAARRWFAREC